MAEVTRRVFLGTGAGAAAAGVAFAAVPGLATAAGAETIAAGRGPTAAPAATPTDVGDGEYVVHVRNARTGEVSVLNGENEVVFTDPQLVARVVAASARP